jgi:amidase
VTVVADPVGAFFPEERVLVEPTASGPLDGLDLAIKDVFDVAGHRTGFGQPDWRSSHPPATRTAPAVEAVLAAGARLVGRTISDELTYSLTGQNVHYGTPLNPRCPERVPGGSSSGSASATAAGLCDVALGTDCAGSVRIPSSYCGLYGIRPTHGRISLDGVCPFAPSFDTVGWLAREPGVLERAGRVLLGDPGPALPFARLLVALDAFDRAGGPVADALARPLAALHDAVGDSAEVELSPDGLDRWQECFRTIQGFEIWRSLGAWVEETKPELGPGIRERLEWASGVRAEDVDAERRFRAEVVEHLERLIEPGDVLCLPTAPGSAPARDAKGDSVEVDFRNRAISLLCPAGLGGLPQLTMPLGDLDGCPLGLSVVAARGQDLALLRLASSLAAG